MLLRCRIEQIKPNNGLIHLKMMKSNKRLAPLEKGQLWKTDKAYIEVWDIGKRLIDYKMMKELGKKAVRTQATSIDTLEEYLKTQKAVLAKASPA